MKSVVITLLCCGCIGLHSQSISLFNLDASKHPQMKAQFYAFDKNGIQQRPTAADLVIREDGVQRVITGVSCPPVSQPPRLSTVLTIDVSGSMSSSQNGGTRMDLAKAAATSWVDALPAAGNSECAITSFDGKNYLNQDFTTDLNRLHAAVASLQPQGGTDYNQGLSQPMAGSCVIAQTGKYKRVVVFLSDGLPNFEPNTSAIISQALSGNITVFCVTLGMPCPTCLKDISASTGGSYFENVTTIDQAKAVYQQILSRARGNAPCELTWTSDKRCTMTITHGDLESSATHTAFEYNVTTNSIPFLTFSPSYLFFRSKPIGVRFDTTVIVTAFNGDYTVTNIRCSNAIYSIQPTSFVLRAGQSQVLHVSFTPPDSGYSWTNFTFESDRCPAEFSASARFPSYKKAASTLKITFPNGGEKLIAGSDTLITWTGIAPSDSLVLEYTTNQGASWDTISSAAGGNAYLWHVPKKVSTQCLVRGSQVLHTSDFGEPLRSMPTDTLWCGFVYPSYMSMSPDGTKIAGIKDNGELAVFDAATGIKIQSYPRMSNLFPYLSWSADSYLLLYDLRWDTLAVVDTRTRGVIAKYPTKSNESIQHASFERNSTRIAMAYGYSSPIVVIWDYVLNSVRKMTMKSTTSALWWNPNGTELLCRGTYNYRIVDVPSGIERDSIVVIAYNSFIPQWTSDGSKIAIVEFDSNIVILDATKMQRIRTIRVSSARVTGIRWNDKGDTLSYATNSASTYNIDTLSWSIRPMTVRTSTNFLWFADWNDARTRILTGSDDHVGRVWFEGEKDCHSLISGQSGKGIIARWKPDGQQILTSGTTFPDNAVIWDVGPAKVSRVYYNPGWVYGGGDWSPDGKKCVFGNQYSASIIDVQKWTLDTTLIRGYQQTPFLRWSPDGTKIAESGYNSNNSDYEIRFFDPKTSDSLMSIPSNYYSSVTNAIWDRSSQTLLASYTNGGDGHAVLWDVQTRKEIFSVKGNYDEYSSITLNPLGGEFAHSGFNSSIAVLNMNTNAVRTMKPGHTAFVSCLDWSPDGSRIASGSADKTVMIWDAISGNKLATLRGHRGQIISVQWSPDGNRIVSGSKDSTAIVWSIEDFSQTVQSDVSDGLFAIVAPAPASQDVDMHQAIVGSIRDSVVSTFVTNTGSYTCRVDSVRIGGADAAMFQLVSGMPPYLLAAGAAQPTEFRFHPSSTGIKTATLTVFTQTDTLIQNIHGEGTEPQLSVVNNVIDFGAVPLGAFKDTLQTITIQNTGTGPLDITNSSEAGPSLADFAVISGDGSFQLQPGASRRMDIRFAPTTMGRSNGSVQFEYSGPGSPAKVQLFGTGLGGIISLSKDSAYVGEKKVIRLQLLNDIKPQVQAGTPIPFRAHIASPAAVYAVTQPKNMNITAKGIEYDVEGSWNGVGQTLGSFEVRAGLSSVDTTTLELQDFVWLRNDGTELSRDVELHDGSLKILGICVEGGKRLINSEGVITLMLVRPNPVVGNAFDAELELTEIGLSSLRLMDANGQLVKTFFEGENLQGRRTVRLHVDELATGAYYLKLQTPTEQRVQPLEIIR